MALKTSLAWNGDRLCFSNKDVPCFMLTLNSYAKLNLYLEVLHKRKDNYHNIKTVFERIGLADKIILKSRRDKKINITCAEVSASRRYTSKRSSIRDAEVSASRRYTSKRSSIRDNVASVPQDNSNLACRSAKLLQEAFNIDKGVDIKIIKRIPVGSGLGGGSSDAATVLVGLNKLWKLNLTRDKLARLAGKLGCDVPFFIYNIPFARGQARGEKIRPLNSLANVRLWHILVVPKIGVSTASIYKEWDAEVSASRRYTSKRSSIRDAEVSASRRYTSKRSSIRDKYSRAIKKERLGLTIPKYNVNILISALRKSNLSLLGNALFNSLGFVTARLYPQINAIKERLTQLGVKSILMSGSGPAVFGIVSSRKEALSLSRQLKSYKRFRVFVTRTR